jgi:transposase InsO family protein
MAAENPTWGEEHIANELKLKLGIRVSPRTVQKYLAGHCGRTPDPRQRWLTFVHNHAQAIVACDFFVVFTARFRILYVFVIMELGRRQILHHNVTAHPSAEWTLQQFREALKEEHPYRFLIHDRDSIFSKDLDKGVTAMGVRILKTPVRAPKANAVCERLVGTIRRECLDFLIPFGERHLKRLLTHWVAHFNHAIQILCPYSDRRRPRMARSGEVGAHAVVDRKWVVDTVPFQDRDSTSRVKAFPTDGGDPLVVCQRCFIKWSRDQKALFVAFRSANAASLEETIVLPIAAGQALPKLPAGGQTLENARTLPGAKVIGVTGVFPGIHASQYTYVNSVAHRNLYRLTLPR